jgi:hypothetical protein
MEPAPGQDGGGAAAAGQDGGGAAVVRFAVIA